MSNDGQPKDHTDLSNIFSIGFEDDADGVPGVTQLLNPGMLKAKAEEATKKKPPLPPSRKETSTSIPVMNTTAPEIEIAEAPAPLINLHSSAATSLAELGVHFELQFEMERGVFRYTRMKAHSKPSLALWQQKFYFQMKIDLNTLDVKDAFQEFDKTKNTFQADAFGLVDATHLQFVRMEGEPLKLFVLVSEKALVSEETTVREFLAKGNSSTKTGDDDFKIELAS